MDLNVASPYSIISISQKDLWDSYIKESVTYDFYHTWYYHSIEKSGNALLFVYEERKVFVAIPLIKRPIENTGFFDLTSVYGYAGPVSNRLFSEIPDEYIQGFKESFLGFLSKENIVSVFSRLHPIITQDVFLSKLGGIYENGKTVVVDLKATDEEIAASYRRSIRQKINQLRRKGFIVKEGLTVEEIKQFAHIYNENMLKVKASNEYFFNYEYFSDLLNADTFESKLLLAYQDENLVAGGVVTFSNNIMQFHLAATSNSYLKEAPMKLLFDEAAKIGRDTGMNYLHLGGGVGGREDSLYEFKSGFSHIRLQFKTWRYIANLSVYNSLVELKSTERQLGNKFPLYRS